MTKALAHVISVAAAPPISRHAVQDPQWRPATYLSSFKASGTLIVNSCIGLHAPTWARNRY